LEAATRGLKVACIEREDFSSGTSSRSTKLLWGGSRYLVQAFVNLLSTNVIFSPVLTFQKFYHEFKMVMHCHRERKFMVIQQPHLASWVPIAVPLTKWFLWPPPFGWWPAAIGPLGLFPVFFKFVSFIPDFLLFSFFFCFVLIFFGTTMLFQFFSVRFTE
jgi:glycerol-3-phosphate dehydrogenase